jgi:hypothetical protein
VVEIDVTVWAWSTGSQDTLDLYYAANAAAPSWVYITSIVPPGGGLQVLSAQYTLPAGGLQAVRGNFRYQGSVSPCTVGSYNDHDDLIFAVETVAPVCVVDADCSNGLFCDGAEVCNAGVCEPGAPPVCDDGVACTVDACNEASDSCDNAPDNGLCDNGLFCDGAETCDPVLDCQPGGDPCPGQVCDEGSNSCVACIVDADCSNGLFCDGAEVCNAGVCEPGAPPVCDDGVGCTVDACNEGSDSCDNVPDDGLCDNGLFCDGAEACDPTLDCQPGSDPCAPLACDEGGDVCVGGANPRIWMSFKTNTSVPGVGTVTNEDIVSYDEVTGTWALEFDGSDVGLGSLEIGGLAILPSGELLLSFTVAGTVGGLSVDDSDIVLFTPTSLGSSTSGTFSMYFDGSDVGLTTNSEDIDAIALASDGRLIISTTGTMSANGVSNGLDEDLFLFTGTLGTATSGSFTQYFDGSDVALNTSSNEDVDAATLTIAGELLFSTLGDFAVSGLAGANEDVAQFSGSFGTSTSGTFSMRQDLSARGIATSEDVGALEIVE